MDGFDFLESFKRLDIPNIEDIKIIIVTSSVNDNDVGKVKAMGINYYLTKPLILIFQVRIRAQFSGGKIMCLLGCNLLINNQ